MVMKARLIVILVMHDLGGRGQAVGGAGSVRNDMVLLRIVLVFVDAQHDGQVFAFGGGGNDDLLGATGGDVIDCTLDGLALLVDAVFLDGEQTGRLDHDVHAQVFPRDGGRIGFLEDFDFLAIDQQTIVGNFDGAIEAAIGRIVLEQVRHRLHVADIVEGNHFQVSSG